MMKKQIFSHLTVAALLFLFATITCAGQSAKSGVLDHTSKIRPPVTVDYKILGTPTLGQPLEVELTVHSSVADTAVRVEYHAMDSNALKMQAINNDGQSFKLVNANVPNRQKIVVIPQQEGRNVFLVTTYLQLPSGDVANSRAIAITVGDGEKADNRNGNLTLDENGEAIISMPTN